MASSTSTTATATLLEIKRGIDLGDTTVNVGCSIGIARTECADGGPMVLAHADHAMYDAKRNGGQRWTIHTEELGAEQVGTG